MALTDADPDLLEIALTKATVELLKVQGDQINMAVLFWYLVKSNASVRYCTSSDAGQVTLSRVPEQHGRV